LLSVIITTFNEEKYIGRTLKSLVSSLKSAVESEIVVVDSGEDKTFTVAKSFTDKVYKFKERGVSKARNYAVSKTCGDVLVFIDADTVVTTENFKETTEMFKDKNVVAVLAKVNSYKSLSLSEKIFYMADHAFINSCERLSPLLRFYNRGDFLAVKRNVFFEVGGFNEDMNILEITELLLKLTSCGKIRVLKNPVYDSGRRLEKWGVLKSHLIWVKNYFSFYFKNKYDEVYEVVR
jgi:glycosyltransferase involved in cell wall biosynthesis